MRSQKIALWCSALMALLGMGIGTGSALAGSLNISQTPLSTATSVDPNVFFELDDSGSMDWEVMPQNYWTWQAYNPDESSIGGSFNSADGGMYANDGYWYSHYLRTTKHGSSYYQTNFNYIFDNSDNLYGTSCGSAVIPCGSPDFVSNLPYELDWRILSSSLNTIYYDPSQTYSPWVGPCDSSGTYCTNASFTAARSNPWSGSTGYSLTRDLTGFVYEVWVDDKGFDPTVAVSGVSGRPHRGTNVNVTNTPNGIVDLWDTHVQYTVYADHVDIVTTSYAPDSTGMNPTSTTTTISGTGTDAYGHTVAQIQQNVANWYQYYRKRSFVAKGAIAAVIAENPSFRYGLSVINASSTLFQEVPPASATDYSTYNTALLTNLFSYTWHSYGTPLRSGLQTVGEYYRGALSGKTNPIISACQKCFAILFTDGYWNGSFSSSTISDADGDGISNTLADVARYYYTHDLSSYADQVVPDAYDPATWQHMVTYGVAFGVTGNLVDTDSDGWPNPVLTESGNWGDPTACTDCAPKIDDLWHAAYNSKGTFISAKNPADVVTALRNALQDISNRVSSMAAVSLNSGSISSLSKLYQAKFNSYTWDGFLEAKNVSNGVVGSVAWEAGSLLPSATNRVILTSDGSSGVPFEWSSLSASEQTALNTNSSGTVDSLGSARLSYLRGDASNELINGGTFRNRTTTKLGDIINSSPQLSSGENFFYPDTIASSSYSSFVTWKSNRTPMVYVGANDGMLHGFDGVTGVERLAYVPTSVYSNLSKLTSSTYSHRYYVDGTPTVGDAYYGGAWHTTLVGGLQAGGQGIYALDVTDPSQFTEANAASVVLWEFTDANDSDLGYTYSRPNIVKMADGTWAAVFGNGYNNTDADSHVSGTGDAALYIVNLQTGALIKKISTGVGSSQDPTGAARPNGLATVTPVDVNGDGVTDYIYGGDLFGNLWKFDVSSSSSSSWDVAFHASGAPAPLFTACGGATCNSSNAQSITTRVTVGFGPNRIGYMVYFGTGKYIESSDVNDLSVQTLYGIWDKNDGSTTVSGRSTLLQQTILYEGTYTLQDGTTSSDPLRVTSDNHYSTSPPTELGWYIDLVSPVSGDQGERIIYDPILRSGKIIFVTTIPNSNSCSGGGDSWLMAIDSYDGSLVGESPFDLNKDGKFNSDEYVDVGGKWQVVNGVKSGSMMTTPAIAHDNSTGKDIAYISTGSGGVDSKSLNPDAHDTGRQSWLQIK